MKNTQKTKNCAYCQASKPKTKTNSWIVENHFLGSKGQILKETLMGDIASQEKDKEIINTLYYCSINCMERMLDKEEEELWNKGNCSDCQQPLAVINEQCHNLEHQKEACLLPISTPECLKKK